MKSIRSAVGKVLPKNEFARGVSVLVGGSAGAQALMAFSAPILTRLYSPDDFGLLAVYSALLALFLVIASLCYESAIPLPESDQEAANVVVLSLLLVLGVTGASAFIIAMVGDFAADRFGVPRLAKYFWLLPIGILIGGAYKVLYYWAIRCKAFSIIAGTRIRQAVIALLIPLLGFRLGASALLLGYACGQGIGGVSLARAALKSSVFSRCTWAGVKSSARRYRHFPIFSTWSNLFNVAGQQLPSLMFAALFNVGAAGLYSLANQVLAMPMSVISSAIGNVFFSNAAEAHRNGGLGALVRDIHESLAHIAMPVILVLVTVGPELFVLVFGEQWRQSGEFTRWMAPWLYMVFVTSPLSTLVSILERQRLWLLFQSILLLSRMVAIAIGAMYGDLLTAVSLFSIVSALCWVVFVAWVMLVTGNTVYVLVSTTMRALAIAGLCISPLWIGLYFSHNTAVFLVALIGTMLLLFIRYGILIKRVYR